MPESTMPVPAEPTPGQDLPHTETIQSLQRWDIENNARLSVDQAWSVARWHEQRTPAYAVLWERIDDLRSALDAITKELESCRHLLADLQGEDGAMPEEVRERVERADVAIKKAKRI